MRIRAALLTSWVGNINMCGSIDKLGCGCYNIHIIRLRTQMTSIKTIVLTFGSFFSNRTTLSSTQASNRTIAWSSEGTTLRKSLQCVKYSVSSQLKHPLPLTQFCKLRMSRGFANPPSSIRPFLSTKLSVEALAYTLLLPPHKRV
jgi:hypothetical protein